MLDNVVSMKETVIRTATALVISSAVTTIAVEKDLIVPMIVAWLQVMAT